MNRYLLLGLILILGMQLNSAAQTAKEYDGFDKTEVFSDDFMDNHNQWQIYYTKIKKGFYDVEAIGKDQPVLSTTSVMLDSEKNYEIEAMVSVEWNRNETLMGVVWNRGMNSGYYIGFNKNGYLKIYRKEFKEETTLYESKKYMYLYPMYQENKITIRKVDQEFFIFINEYFVCAIDVDDEFKDHVGFFAGMASEIRAKNLAVYYIE